MDAIYYLPSHKHHFRNVEVTDGKADLSDDDGNLVYSAVPISDAPEVGSCVVSGSKKSTKTKPKK